MMQIQEDTHTPEPLRLGGALSRQSTSASRGAISSSDSLPSLHDQWCQLSLPVTLDFKSYQYLLRKMATALCLEPELVQENTHKLLGIHQASVMRRVALLIDDVFLQLVKTLWLTPVSLTSTAKCTVKQ